MPDHHHYQPIKTNKISSNLALVARCAMLLLIFSTVFPGVARASRVSNTMELFGPPGSGAFGSAVTVLPNGNIVVADPLYDAGSIQDVGAIYLYNGWTLDLISVLTGGSAGDKIGEIPIVVLSNGNFVLDSPFWDDGANTDAGAVTWCSGVNGCQGAISAANSLVGGSAYDWIGEKGVTALSNGNYVVRSPWWNNGAVIDAGAITWCSGTSGCTGLITPANSLVGGATYDDIGYGEITELANGHYVAVNPRWDNGAIIDAGAATWCNRVQPCVGVVSSANSLVGIETPYYASAFEITPLTNGNYVVQSQSMVTWCNGIGGCKGAIDANKSLTCEYYSECEITALPNSNYVVANPTWNNRGSVTLCSGVSGCPNVIGSTNSLVGSISMDQVGDGGVTVLINGNYVVSSPYWNNDLGAVTWCNGVTGCSGTVSSANSLVGGNIDEYLGSGIIALANGNYVVNTPNWSNGPAFAAGAVTWCSGASGCQGAISPANSLVGTCGGVDSWGGCSRYPSVTPLGNGSYVVSAPGWDNGVISTAGAVVWCNGVNGCSGVVNSASSLIGIHPGDGVGDQVVALSNSNYVIYSPNWYDGSQRGAVTWCGGTGECNGSTVTSQNSLIGVYWWYSTRVVTALTNGNYLVLNPGSSVTWCSGLSGCKDMSISTSNSLIDYSLGDANENSRFKSQPLNNEGIVSLQDGNFVVLSSFWDNGAIYDAGAVTLGDGASGSITGTITADNSVLGLVDNSSNNGATLIVDYDHFRQRLVVGFPAENRVVVFQAGGQQGNFVYLPMLHR